MVESGRKGEKDCKQFGFMKNAKKMGYLESYDYFVSGLKIDVKTAHIKGLFGSQYNYHIRKKNKNLRIADFLLLMGYKKDCLKNAYLLPAFLVANKNDFGIPEFVPNKFECYRLK